MIPNLVNTLSMTRPTLGFSQICNSDTVVDGRQNLFFAQYLEMKRRNETKFCIHIIIDKIYVGIVKRHFSQICTAE